MRFAGVLGEDAPDPRLQWPYGLDGPVDERCVEPGVPVLVDGVARDGVRIDTDPDVYGLGVDIGANAVLTAAIPRDALPYLDVAFAVRPV